MRVENERKRIKNKWHRVLYFPFALIQWVIFTVILSGLAITLVSPIAAVTLLWSIMMYNKLEIEESFFMMTIGFYLPFRWWYDYITKGEIGIYE